MTLILPGLLLQISPRKGEEGSGGGNEEEHEEECHSGKEGGRQAATEEERFLFQRRFQEGRIKCNLQRRRV